MTFEGINESRYQVPGYRRVLDTFGDFQVPKRAVLGDGLCTSVQRFLNRLRARTNGGVFHDSLISINASGKTPSSLRRTGESRKPCGDDQ